MEIQDLDVEVSVRETEEETDADRPEAETGEVHLLDEIMTVPEVVVGRPT